jgi:hypothetical protein
MRYTKLMLTSLALAAITGAIHLCGPAISQTAGLIPTGNCSLPAGQYMLTNMRTGQAVYVEIDNGGRLMAQDPKALQFAVSPVNYNNGVGGLGTTGGGILNGILPGAAPGGGILNGILPGAAPVGTTGDTTQRGGMWGGLLKQGVQQYMNNRTAPVGAPGSIQQ